MTPSAAKSLLANAVPLDAQVDHYLDMAWHFHHLRNISSVEDVFDDPQVNSHVVHNSIGVYNNGFNRATYRRHKICIIVFLLLFAFLVGVYLFG